MSFILDISFRFFILNEQIYDTENQEIFFKWSTFRTSDPLNLGFAVLKGSGKIQLGPLEFLSSCYPCSTNVSYMFRFVFSVTLGCVHFFAGIYAWFIIHSASIIWKLLKGRKTILFLWWEMVVYELGQCWSGPTGTESIFLSLPTGTRLVKN